MNWCRGEDGKSISTSVCERFTGVLCQLQTAAVVMLYIVVLSVLSNTTLLTTTTTTTTLTTTIIIIINIRPSPSTDWMVVPCVIKQHIIFPEWRPALPIILTKYPAKYWAYETAVISLAPRAGHEVVTSEHRRQCMNRWGASWSSYFSEYLSQNRESDS